MRIISGVKRGKKLLTPKDMRIRPTTDRAREALFSILYAKYFQDFRDVYVLDIFSGTGALGLEAVSRGAKSATFVDIDLKLTKQNVALCGFDNVAYIERDARKLPKARQSYGLIFLDAPYKMGLTEPVLTQLVENGYINKDTLIVAETAVEEEVACSDVLKLAEVREYGAAKFWFFMRREGQ